MKKFLVVLLAIVMCFGMVACADKSSPSAAVEKDIKDAKSAPEEFMGEIEEDGMGKEAQELMIEKFLDFDYKLGEEKIDGDKATVEATFTTYPFGQIMQDVLTKYMTEAFANLDKSEEELETLMNDLLVDGLKNAKKDFVSTVTMELVKEKGEWVVQDSDDLTNAITGGLLDLMSSFGE